MSGNYANLICTRCHRPYTYWPEKGLFASRKFCPDCRVILKSKEIHGLPLEDMAGRNKPEGNTWADSKVIDILSANLTAKQKAAIKSFLDTGIVPQEKSSYYQAIRKLRKAGKAIFRG
jgi:hypothetical protein